jgi:outer membrane lipoprotein carrier protein
MTTFPVTCTAIAVAVCMMSAAPWAQGAQDSESAERVAGALQQRYQGIRDFSADFVHAYRGGVLRTQAVEQGTVVVKKPGRMRWIYTEPERKEFVSDGLTMYAYIPEDRQVMVTRLAQGDDATTGAAFLAGHGDIVRDFVATFDEPPSPGRTSLRLTPHQSQPEYEYLVVTVDPSTLQILALSTRDRQGGDSTLSFTNLQENQGVADKDFVFRIPQGVDIITNDVAN